MKYFAVTDDPNELMHYGIKGMKWGVIRTDAQLGHPNKPSMKKPKLNSLLTKPLSDRDRQAIIAGTYVKTNTKSSRSSVPHSPAYISASSKLRKIMKSGIDKAKASWDNYNSPKARSERMFQKHVQLARQGRLKYKGISDKEVERITDRLALERQARNLSGAEKPSFVRRALSSMGEGVISGLGQGMAKRVSERMSRGATLKTQRMMNEQTAEFNRKQARENFKRSQREQRERDKYADERADKQEREKLENDYQKLAIANQTMDYASAYGNGLKLNYGKSTRRLSNNELRARSTILEDAKKLYGTSEDSKAKAKNGTVTEEYTDENGVVHTVTYSKGGKKDKNSNDSAPSATPHEGPKRPKSASKDKSSRSIHDIDDYIYSDPSPEETQRRNEERAAEIRRAQEAMQRRNEQRAAEIIRAREAAEAARKEDYWARVHSYAQSEERRRAKIAQREENARRKALQEQGYADREARINYRQNVTNYANEQAARQRAITVANNGYRRSANHIGATLNGPSYSVDRPLFIDEEHRGRRSSRNGRKRTR